VPAPDTDLEAEYRPRDLHGEEHLMGKLLFLAKILIYSLPFLAPPILVVAAGLGAADSVRYGGPSVAAADAGTYPALPGYDPHKPTAIVLLGNQGSEVTDVLAPYEVLS